MMRQDKLSIRYKISMTLSLSHIISNLNKGQNITMYRNAGNQGHNDVGDRCRIQFVSMTSLKVTYITNSFLTDSHLSHIEWF